MDDWRALSTAALCADTIRRADNLHNLTMRAFEAVMPAVLGGIPFIAFGSLLMVDLTLGHNPMELTRLTMVVWTAVAAVFWYPFILPHWRATRALKAFTLEMNARRVELVRRRTFSDGRER